HAEAEQLEHAVSDDLIERMASALGHPLYDPHGDPIPTAAGEIEEAELVSLAEAPVGLKLELRQVGTQDSERLRYLAEQGLAPGGAGRWRSRGRAIWWPWATWIRATGPPTWRAGRRSATPCSASSSSRI